MKKLLLTSSGLDNEKVIKEFVSILAKPIGNTKVLLIFGVKTDEELFYVQESKKELIDLGVLEKNIIEANVNNELLPSEFKSFDLIYFCGGNTYYLLDRIRKLKFDNLIKDSINRGRPYIGVSAGSIIVGENIEISGWGSEGDKNEVELKDLKGLGFTNIAIFPHYKNEQEEEVEEFRKKANYPVKELRDGEAILIMGVKKFKEIK